MSFSRNWELLEDLILYIGSTFTILHKHFLDVVLPNLCLIYEIYLSTHWSSNHDVQIEKDGVLQIPQPFCLNKDLLIHNIEFPLSYFTWYYYYLESQALSLTMIFFQIFLIYKKSFTVWCVSNNINLPKEKQLLSKFKRKLDSMNLVLQSPEPFPATGNNSYIT